MSQENTTTPVAILVAPAASHPNHISAREVAPEKGYTRVLVDDAAHQSLDIPSENVGAALKLAKDNGIDARIDMTHIPGFQLLGRIVPASAPEHAPKKQPTPQNRSTITVEGPGIRDESNAPVPAVQVLPNSTVKPASAVGDKRA